MMDCNSMANPMVANMKSFVDFDLIVPFMYRQLIASLMYSVKTRLGICFTVNTLSHTWCSLGRFIQAY